MVDFWDVCKGVANPDRSGWWQHQLVANVSGGESPAAIDNFNYTFEITLSEEAGWKYHSDGYPKLAATFIPVAKSRSKVIFVLQYSKINSSKRGLF